VHNGLVRFAKNQPYEYHKVSNTCIYPVRIFYRFFGKRVLLKKYFILKVPILYYIAFFFYKILHCCIQNTKNQPH
jgi:hypothetical protein